MLCHARSSDAPRGLGDAVVTYDFVTATASDWLTSLPWTKAGDSRIPRRIPPSRGELRRRAAAGAPCLGAVAEATGAGRGSRAQPDRDRGVQHGHHIRVPHLAGNHSTAQELSRAQPGCPAVAVGAAHAGRRRSGPAPTGKSRGACCRTITAGSLAPRALPGEAESRLGAGRLSLQRCWSQLGLFFLPPSVREAAIWCSGACAGGAALAMEAGSAGRGGAVGSGRLRCRCVQGETAAPQGRPTTAFRCGPFGGRGAPGETRSRVAACAGSGGWAGCGVHGQHGLCRGPFEHQWLYGTRAAFRSVVLRLAEDSIFANGDSFQPAHQRTRHSLR